MGSASLQHRLEPHRRMYPQQSAPARGYTTSLLCAVEEAFFATTRDAVLLVNLDMNIAFANSQAHRLFGYTPAELIAAPIQFLIPEPFRRLYDHFWQRHMADSRASESDNAFEVLGQHKDGAVFPVEIRARWLQHDRGLFVLQVIKDLRERNALLEELRQAQKMEVIGRLAGGVAHDFNNVLTVMNGYSEMLSNSTETDAHIRSMAREIRMAGERGARITGQLLAFSRRQHVEPQILNLTHAVSRMEGMLQRLIGEKIALALELCPELGQVMADPGQIDQVLLNLVVNARDAMPDGGKLTIATSHEHIEDGQFVQLSVTDTGCGMDKATQAHIFEHLFTTKGPGKGTGLGLSIVHQVMTQSNGHIVVASEPGRGSTFKLLFPRVDGPGEATAAEPGKPIPCGNEKILLVEDDAAVRGVMQTTLRQYGYTVIEAGDAGTAMKRFHETPIPLVVVDVVLPHMTGPQLAQRLRSESPHLKILYISGYTDDTDLSELNPRDSLLLKPFTPSLLAVRIREVLDAPH